MSGNSVITLPPLRFLWAAISFLIALECWQPICYAQIEGSFQAIDRFQSKLAQNQGAWRSLVTFDNVSKGPGTAFLRIAQYHADEPSMVHQGLGTVLEDRSDPAAFSLNGDGYPNYFDTKPGPAWQTGYVCDLKQGLCDFRQGFCNVKTDVCCDFKNFFSKRNTAEFALALGVAASFANTSVDEDFQNWIDRQGLSYRHVDNWYRDLGDGAYMIPLVFATNIFGNCWNRYRPNPCAQNLEYWGYRSVRSYGVGIPALILTQWSTGASRPGEAPHGSEWRFFNDDNGASGHAFIGAVPFLVAADLTDRPAVKGLLYVGSGLVGFSRISDDAHYLSQVILGWTIAHISVRATRMTDCQRQRYSFTPQTIHGNPGIGVTFRR